MNQNKNENPSKRTNNQLARKSSHLSPVPILQAKNSLEKIS